MPPACQADTFLNRADRNDHTRDSDSTTGDIAIAAALASHGGSRNDSPALRYRSDSPPGRIAAAGERSDRPETVSRSKPPLKSIA